MNRLFVRLIESLFSKVAGNAGAIASLVGFFLGFVPFLWLKIVLMLLFSVIFRLNVAAILFGMLFSLFLLIFQSLSFLFSHSLEGLIILLDVSFHLDGFPLPSFDLLGRMLAGIFSVIILFPSFKWLYNAGINKQDQTAHFIFQDSSKHRRILIKRMGIGLLFFTIFILISFFQSISKNPSFPSLQLGAKSISPNFDSSETLLLNRLKEENSKKIRDPHLQEVYGMYVNWDENSKESLKQNIDSMTTVVPE